MWFVVDTIPEQRRGDAFSLLSFRRRSTCRTELLEQLGYETRPAHLVSMRHQDRRDKERKSWGVEVKVVNTLGPDWERKGWGTESGRVEGFGM